jgi:endonuclease/exonuclease/phosphatase family metal-dependent hydrolase
MSTVRMATFNVENLFARFKFDSGVDPEQAVKDGWDANKTFFTILDEDEKKLSGKLIRSLHADVLALQEVESLDTLRRFRRDYLGGPKVYPYSVLLDGNDPRLIDVAVLSKHPIVHARSNQHLRSGNSYVFSRDCLEVEIDIEGAPLYLFVNHFKSMLDKNDPKNGRRKTRAKRQQQAGTVKEIIEARFGKQAGKEPFVVLGDLNDYLEADDAGSTGISELVEWEQVENVVARRPADDRWTHYFHERHRIRTPTSSSTTYWSPNPWPQRRPLSPRSRGRASHGRRTVTRGRASPRSVTRSPSPPTTARSSSISRSDRTDAKRSWSRIIPASVNSPRSPARQRLRRSDGACCRAQAMSIRCP